jgi:hypothetical protein
MTYYLSFRKLVRGKKGGARREEFCCPPSFKRRGYKPPGNPSSTPNSSLLTKNYSLKSISS